MSADLIHLLRQTADDHDLLWPQEPVPALRWLSLRATVVGDAHAALAPGGVCAGDGWLECADRTAWLTKEQDLSDLARQASPILCAELVLSATSSRHLRRGRSGVVLTDFDEFADLPPAAAQPCLVFEREWLSTDPHRVLVYRVYWTMPIDASGARGRLRPWAARLSEVARSDEPTPDERQAT